MERRRRLADDTPDSLPRLSEYPFMMSREAQRSSSRSFLYIFRLLLLMPMLRAPSTRAAGILVFEAGPARPAVLNHEGSRVFALDAPSNGLTIFAIDAQSERCASPVCGLRLALRPRMRHSWDVPPCS